MALLMVICFAAPAFCADDGPIVDTPKGKVRGFVKNGVDVFLGVPAGKPPYEEGARLMAAQPVDAWSGVMDCTRQASLPLQVGTVETDSAGKKHVSPKGGGDCLRMNIWTPKGQPKNCPVLVYIPGGGSINCNPASVEGSAFARDGIVAVAVPYRVNVDGFMKIKGAPANLAIRDMIFDLRWVRDNIASFGGDPDNVTIMGQSAGSTHIGSLLASPLAKGLFKRAIMMSGSHLAQWTPEQADRAAKMLAEYYGVEPSREGIMSLPYDRLISFGALASQKLKDPEWMKYTNGNGTLFKPYVDGEVLPRRPVDAVAGGASKDVDVLIGSTADEWNYVTVPSGLIDRLAKKDIQFVLDGIGAPADVADKYRANGRGKTDGEVYSAIQSDIIFRVPTNRMVEARSKSGGKTWVYSFQRKNPGFNGRIGAVHWSDVPFAFDMLKYEGNPQIKKYLGDNPPQALADRMHGAWVNFIRNGDPGWRQYDPGKRNILIIDEKTWEEKNDPWKNERELIILK